METSAEKTMNKADIINWILEKIERHGLATILVFFALGLFTGVIPSPLADLQADSATHKADTKVMKRELRKQSRVALEQCMDNKRWHKEDPKGCIQAQQEAVGSTQE